MPIYMQIEGINGSVTAAGHEKWIELHSFQFGVNRNVTSASGRGANREASTPALSEIVVTKDLDVSTTALFKMALWGEGKKVKIDFVKTNKDKFEKFQDFELENALISSFNSSGHGGDAGGSPMESLSLNYTKLTWVTTLTNDKNGSGKPDRAMWDLASGKGG